MAAANTQNWPNNSRLALSIVVNVEEGSEYTLADGDRGPEVVDELGIAIHKPIRNYGNESNYQYGIKAGGPRILKLLDQFDITATFTAAALSLERAPYLADYIRNGAHEACSHGYRWIHQFRMSEDEEREFIQQAVTSIEQTTGERPHGWLSRYLHTEHTRRLLHEEGFSYHMDDYSDDFPYWAMIGDQDVGNQGDGGEPMVIMPYALDSNDMKMWTDPAYTPDQWLKYAIDTFDCLYAEGAEAPRMMSLGLHLRIIGRPGRIGALKAFFEHVRRHDDVWVTTRKTIADHFAATVPAPGAQ